MGDETINLGAIERVKDPRDWKLGAIQAPVQLPLSYMPANSLDWYPKYYQAELPTCGANAGSSYQNVALPTNVPLSPRELWREIKNIDGFPLSAGTDMRSIFKALCNQGVSSEAVVPNDIGLSLEEYSNLTLTPEILADALKRKGLNYAFIDNDAPPTLEDIKQATYQNKACLVLIKCDDGFFGTQYPTFSANPPYGHFVNVIGWTEEDIAIFDSTEQNESLSVKYIDNKYINPTFFREGGVIGEFTQPKDPVPSSVETPHPINIPTVPLIHPTLTHAELSFLSNLLLQMQKILDEILKRSQK